MTFSLRSNLISSPTMPRHIRDFYVTSARKFKLNNDFSCLDNEKNGRNLPTESMFCAITSFLVKFRKSLHMAFEDDTSVENTRPFLRFYLSENQWQILSEFGLFRGWCSIYQVNICTIVSFYCVWSLLCYCVRNRDHCCVLCDVARDLLLTWYIVHQPISRYFLYGRKLRS